MQNEKSPIQSAKENIDIVEYLANLDHHPTRYNGQNYWYISPLRTEKTASFVVDRNKQLWYDHGMGKGGDLITFAKEFHQCNYQHLAEIFQKYMQKPLVKKGAIAVKRHEILTRNGSNNLDILSENTLEDRTLKVYLVQRGISVELANKYLKEIKYRIADKTYCALGFSNNEGGYELRNASFKGSAAPKSTTTILISKDKIATQQQKLAVFEGFFSMLSFVQLVEEKLLDAKIPDCILVLNSISFLTKAKDLVTKYRDIDLYLDNDLAGNVATSKALSWKPGLRDQRSLYQGLNDLNDFLVTQLKMENRSAQTRLATRR